MKMKPDYYQTLGVERGASPDTIKKAYRALAMKYHPDRNPGDAAAEQKFKEISEAYDVLKDDQKRAAYDRFGHSAFENGSGGFRGGRSQGFDFAGAGFADIFNEMFGDFAQMREPQAQMRGADLRYNMEIHLEEAFAGTQATIRVPSALSCEACHGTGGEKGAEPVPCPACRGQGRQRASQGFFTIERTCQTCHGAGRIIEKPCRKCQGSGRVRKDKTLSVTIPPGVEEGTRIRLAGEGDAGMQGAPAGDLYIFLSIKPHPMFQREGPHIHCRVPIPMTLAALGGEIEIPTIDGIRAQLNIPPGTQTGQTLRQRGKGMSILRSHSRGDMVVEIAVETPVHLTKRQKELLAEFAAADGKGKNSPESEGFFTKVKNFWNDIKTQ